jgi:lipopolysaccharide transport system permease protein
METVTSDKLSGLNAARAAGDPARGAPPIAPRLPEEPLVVIEPTHSWSALNLRELWDYRELLYYLTWRDVKVRYKQTMLGVAWVVLQPLMMTVVFTIILGVLVRVPSGPVPYPLLVYVGLLPWTFFSSSVSASGASLVGNSHLITKVYFPRPLVPIAAVGGRLIDLSISFIILAGMMIFYRVTPTWSLLALPALVALVTLLALGIGTLLASLNVKYRDVGILLPVLVQLWMYLSPVIYPSSLVPARWRWLYSLNPMVGIIDGFRASLFGGAFDLRALVVSATAAALILTFAFYLFRRVERSFADVI